MKKLFEYLTDIIPLLFVLALVGFFAHFFLTMFGVLSYDVPMTQERENVVQVELVDCKNYPDSKVLRTLTGDDLDRFLDDFQKLKAKRYASDPPSPYGEIMIAVYYADGCVDRIGNVMNTSCDASGNPISAGGWYHFPDGSLERLFSQYDVSEYQLD